LHQKTSAFLFMAVSQLEILAAAFHLLLKLKKAIFFTKLLRSPH